MSRVSSRLILSFQNVVYLYISNYSRFSTILLNTFINMYCCILLMMFAYGLRQTPDASALATQTKDAAEKGKSVGGGMPPIAEGQDATESVPRSSSCVIC
jgi:hypothetical protein